MSLRNLLAASEFVVTVELDPPKGSSPKAALANVAQLRGLVDAVNIADCPMANMRMSSIALACLLQLQGGLETIFHLTCRDRNRIGLQSELLGAAGLGVKNILTLTGDHPERGDHPEAQPVFETDALGLLRLATNLNEGHDAQGNPLTDATDFFIGTTANPGADDLPAEIEKLRRKIDAGAHFVQTQPVYDLEKAKRFMDAAAPLGVPILLGLIPLRSYRMAHYLHTKVPGISLTPEILARMEEGGPAAGIEIAKETLAHIRNLAQGVHLMPLNHMETVVEILRNDA